MSSRRLNIFLFILLLLATAVYYLNAIAQVNFFYWTFWWYDIMMHFLTGLVVSGFAIWMFVRFTSPSRLQVQRTLCVAISAVLIIGIGWEFFEYFNGMYVGQVNIVRDTIGDLIMDTLGALASWGSVRLLLTQNIAQV